MLLKTLQGLEKLKTESRFSYEIVIVDNDYLRTAEKVVYSLGDQLMPKVIYDCEPTKGIPLARNRSIRNANGTL